MRDSVTAASNVTEVLDTQVKLAMLPEKADECFSKPEASSRSFIECLVQLEVKFDIYVASSTSCSLSERYWRGMLMYSCSPVAAFSSFDSPLITVKTF